MRTSTSLFVLFCLNLIPVISCLSCDTNTCNQTCGDQSISCPTFNCGQAKKCFQVCQGSSTSCKALTCSGKQCGQYCMDCPKNTKLTCAAENCQQTCQGKTCEMECTKEVKSCKQVCSENSICKLTCHSPDSNCSSSCRNASCSYTGSEPPSVPVITSYCDENKCEKRCTGFCRDRPLSCSAKECKLSCDGCEMICENTVEKCEMKCIGKSRCKMTCKARSCSRRGICSSSAGLRGLSQLLYAALLGSFLFSLM